MTTSIQGLTERPGGPDQNGKQYYEPIVIRVKAHSIKIATQYSLVSLAGFDDWWDFSQTRYEGMEGPVQPNQWYKMQMSTKAKTGQGAKPGAKYQDITRCRPATDDEIPQGSAGEQRTAAPEGNGGYRSQQDEKFRTKEELRWTEALHMASRHAATDPASVTEEVAAWYYAQLCHVPTEPREEYRPEPSGGAPVYQEPIDSPGNGPPVSADEEPGEELPF